jgi:hypothetical protein
VPRPDELLNTDGDAREEWQHPQPRGSWRVGTPGGLERGGQVVR